MRTKRITAVAAVWAAFSVVGQIGVAKDRVESVFTESGKVAVRGYDTVAYLKESRPVKGSPQFTAQWMGSSESIGMNDSGKSDGCNASFRKPVR